MTAFDETGTPACGAGGHGYDTATSRRFSTPDIPVASGVAAWTTTASCLGGGWPGRWYNEFLLLSAGHPCDMIRHLFVQA